MTLPTLARTRDPDNLLGLPLINFDAIGAEMYPPGRSDYPNINEWKLIHAQVQSQLILLSLIHI